MQENQLRPLSMNEQKGSGHAWVIGGVAVLALILAWTAFNRTGEDVVPTAAEEAAEAQQELETSANAVAEETEDIATEAAVDAEIATARVEARADLLALQTKLEADAAYEDVQQDLNQIEANLEAVYENTSAELQAEYQEIQQELETLGDSIQDETGDALEVIANLSLMLDSDVRTGE